MEVKNTETHGSPLSADLVKTESQPEAGVNAVDSEPAENRVAENKVCPGCSFENIGSAKFCSNCGMALSEGCCETLVENTTHFTVDILKSAFSQLWIVSLACFLLAAVTLTFIIITDAKIARIIFVFCCVIFIFCGIVYAAVYFKMMKDKRFKSDNKQVCYFTEDDIIAEYFEHGEKNSSGALHYCDVSGVLRRKRVLLIYFLNNTQCYPVDVKSFTKGTEYDLYGLLKRKCSPKAVKKYKSKQIK